MTSIAPADQKVYYLLINNLYIVTQIEAANKQIDPDFMLKKLDPKKTRDIDTMLDLIEELNSDTLQEWIQHDDQYIELEKKAIDMQQQWTDMKQRVTESVE